MSGYGFVYVMRNASMKGVFKIGCTSKSPAARAKDLSKTSVPTPFEVVMYGELDGAFEYERKLHRQLIHRQISPDREFFELTFNQLSGLADEIKEQCENFIACSAFYEEEYEYRKGNGEF